MNQIWEHIVRLRTWLVNTVGALLIILPELLNAPEILAVIPAGYQKWVFVAALVLNVWMRPRPAALAKDASVQVTKAVKAAEGPVVVEVVSQAGTEAVIRA